MEATRIRWTSLPRSHGGSILGGDKALPAGIGAAMGMVESSIGTRDAVVRAGQERAPGASRRGVRRPRAVHGKVPGKDGRDGVNDGSH